MSGAAQLPSFDNPPVVEVYLSAQFTPVEGLTAAHIGLLWDKFRKNLPQVEQHAPIEHSLETFGKLNPLKRQLLLQIPAKPSCPRIWFKNESGTELIQVQEDRFIHNWRKTAEGQEYPRFEQIRDNFANELQTFQDFLVSEKLGRLLFDQCEISYVNHISLGEHWKDAGDLHKVLKYWNKIQTRTFTPEPEFVAIQERFLITEEAQEVGRLYLELDTAVRLDNKSSLYRLNLLARLKPATNELDGIISRINMGREWIVKTFDDVTTEEMHKIWKKRS